MKVDCYFATIFHVVSVKHLHKRNYRLLPFKKFTCHLPLCVIEVLCSWVNVLCHNLWVILTKHSKIPKYPGSKFSDISSFLSHALGSRCSACHRTQLEVSFSLEPTFLFSLLIPTKFNVLLIPVLQGMTGQGWVWIGSDGVLATPPSNKTNAAQAMQGSVGIMPKGTCQRNWVWVYVLLKDLCQKRHRKLHFEYSINSRFLNYFGIIPTEQWIRDEFLIKDRVEV